MAIRDEVLRAVRASPRCVFSEEIQAALPHIKIGSIQSAAFELLDKGVLRAFKKDRPNAPIATVFYERDDQVAGVQGLMPYSKMIRAPRVYASKVPDAAEPDVLITLTIEGDKKVQSVTVTFDCARRLHATLSRVFASGGG